MKALIQLLCILVLFSAGPFSIRLESQEDFRVTLPSLIGLGTLTRNVGPDGRTSSYRESFILVCEKKYDVPININISRRSWEDVDRRELPFRDLLPEMDVDKAVLWFRSLPVSDRITIVKAGVITEVGKVCQRRESEGVAFGREYNLSMSFWFDPLFTKYNVSTIRVRVDRALQLK